MAAEASFGHISSEQKVGTITAFLHIFHASLLRRRRLPHQQVADA